MLLRAFLMQNVAIGCSFGAFGVSVLPLQQRYAVGSGTVALGLSLVILAMGVLGPPVALSAQRFGLRATMSVGALLSGCGYALLAVAPDIVVALLAFGLLIGPGVALFGSIPNSLLAAGWFPAERGRAVGIANMPVLVAIAPLIGLALIQDHGLPAFYGVLAGLHLLLLPVLIGVRNPPALAAKPETPTLVGEAEADRRLLTRPVFWIAVLGGGILNATGITGVTYLVAITVERGVASSSAALLVAVMGAASVAGSFGIGWLGDRIGGARALSLVAAGHMVSWTIMATVAPLSLMLPAMLVIGACGAGVFPSVNILFARLFGMSGLGRAIGMFGLLTLPMTFLLPPAAGVLRDVSGSYLPVMATIIVACASVAVIFLRLSMSARSHDRGRTT